MRYANFFLPPHYAKREREQVTIASQLGRQPHTAGKLVNIYFNILLFIICLFIGEEFAAIEEE